MDLERFLKIGTFLIALFGVVGFFLKENYAEQQRQAARTLVLVDQVRAGETFDRRLRMLERLSSFRLKELTEREPSSAVVDKLLWDVFQSTPEFQADFLSVTNSFDSAAICSNVGQCNRDILGKHLKSDAEKFFSLYGQLIRKVRSELLLEGFGSNLEKWVSE